MLTGQAGGASTADELLRTAETFCRRSKAGRSGSELGEELILLRRTCDLLELEFSETAGEFAASDQYEREGSVTVIDSIRHQLKMGGHAAADRVCVGEQLSRLPLSSEALAEGQIGFAHLSLLAHTARALSAAPSGRGFDEGKLLEKAVESSPGRFRHVCQLPATPATRRASRRRS